MFTWFGDLKIAHKLFLGFGLVLCLTLAQSLISWDGLGNLVRRSEVVSDVSRLNDALGDLREARLRHAMANGAPAESKQLQAALEAFKPTLAKLREVMIRAQSQALIDTADQALQGYSANQAASFRAYEKMRAAQKEMGVLATQSFASIEQIRNQVRALPDAEQRFVRSEAINQIRENLILLRYHVRGYTGNTNAETEKLMNSQIATTVNDLPGLVARFNGNFPQQFQQLQQQVQAYAAAVEAFRGEVSNLVGYRAAMAKDIETLNGVIGQLLDDQATLVAKDSHFARTLQIATTLLALLIGALAAVVIARQISQPLRQALSAMEQVAAGDLSEQPASRRRDEVGQLQNALQGMTRNLRELIAQVRDGISQIASATEELSAITEQTSAGANNQKVETDQVATAMQEMAATVHEVARNAGEASEAASATDEEAREGDSVVNRAVVQISRLASQVDATGEAMDALRSESQRIGKVMAKRRGEVVRRRRAGEVARHDDEAAVARRPGVRRELHASSCSFGLRSVGSVTAGVGGLDVGGQRADQFDQVALRVLDERHRLAGLGRRARIPHAGRADRHQAVVHGRDLVDVEREVRVAVVAHHRARRRRVDRALRALRLEHLDAHAVRRLEHGEPEAGQRRLDRRPQVERLAVPGDRALEIGD